MENGKKLNQASNKHAHNTPVEHLIVAGIGAHFGLENYYLVTLN